MRFPDKRLERGSLILSRLRSERLYIRDLVGLLDDETSRMSLIDMRLREVDRHLDRAEQAMNTVVDLLRADNHSRA